MNNKEDNNDDECDCYECYIDMLLMMDGQAGVYKQGSKKKISR